MDRTTWGSRGPGLGQRWVAVLMVPTVVGSGPSQLRSWGFALCCSSSQVENMMPFGALPAWWQLLSWPRESLPACRGLLPCDPPSEWPRPMLILIEKTVNVGESPTYSPENFPLLFFSQKASFSWCHRLLLLVDLIHLTDSVFVKCLKLGHTTCKLLTVWGQNDSLLWGTPLCNAWYLAVNLASTHWQRPVPNY